MWKESHNINTKRILKGGLGRMGNQRRKFLLAWLSLDRGCLCLALTTQYCSLMVSPLGCVFYLVLSQVPTR